MLERSLKTSPRVRQLAQELQVAFQPTIALRGGCAVAAW
jgi:hypothetical protein